MKLQELSTYRKKLSSTDFIYRADLFSKAIWERIVHPSM